MAVEGELGSALALPRADGLSARLRAYWWVARWGIFAGALVYCALVLSGNANYFATEQPLLMGDGAAYYFSDTPYDWSDRPAGSGEYRYSPAFLIAIAPLRLLPWEAFVAVWFLAHIAVLLYLRLPWMLVLPFVMEDALWGNINIFLALAVVLIVRRTGAPLWSAVLLTKVTPGVAAVWHLGRREYREFAWALAITAIVLGIGFALDPQLWSEWFRSLAAGPQTYPATIGLAVPLPVRMALAAILSVYAATSNRPWLLPIGVILAMPGIWPHTFALLVASVALYRGSELEVLEPLAMVGRDLVPVPVAAGTPLVLNSRSSIRK